MKKQYLRRNAAAGIVAVCLAIVCSVTSSHGATKKSDADAAGANDGASFVVTRSASVGSGVSVNLAVDGKQVAIIGNRGRYRGTLAPGKHVLSVTGDPNLSGQGPNKLEVTVEKGKSYGFVANSKNGKIVLVKQA
jgi:hypothetical protein